MVVSTFFGFDGENLFAENILGPLRLMERASAASSVRGPLRRQESAFGRRVGDFEILALVAGTADSI